MDKHGQLVTKFGFTVQGNGTNAKGQMVKNPRLFKYADKESGTKKTAMSIKVKEVQGFGSTQFLEVVCYSEAMKDAKALKLTAGDKIDFHGRYQIKQGKTHDFHKVNINDGQQIRIFSGRKAKSNEI